MNFQNLQYFLAVAEEGSITRAAERLFISQQALSNHITRLEEELGCRLFTRKPNLELTYAGKYFQKSASRILDIQRQTATAMGDINGSRRGELPDRHLLHSRTSHPAAAAAGLPPGLSAGGAVGGGGQHQGAGV